MRDATALRAESKANELIPIFTPARDLIHQFLTVTDKSERSLKEGDRQLRSAS